MFELGFLKDSRMKHNAHSHLILVACSKEKIEEMLPWSMWVVSHHIGMRRTSMSQAGNASWNFIVVLDCMH